VKPVVVVTPDPAGQAAERMAETAAKGGHIVLSGGSTPRAAYERVAEMDVGWSAATLWFGDERCVPPDHEHSNYRMVKEALLDRIEGEQPAVRRMQGELGPDAGADAYEAELRGAFGEGVPRLDLVLMGLGPDAHTASLFPKDDALGETERTVVGVPTPGMAPLVSRVTVTLPLVNAARDVVFLVSGEDKAEAVARAFSGVPDPSAPASLVQPENGSFTLLADEPAASLLEDAR
jgi:6-phosphogluconolactonase